MFAEDALREKGFLTGERLGNFRSDEGFVRDDFGYLYGRLLEEREVIA
jgi:hypothetical protein